jgi:hypothetical protein
MAAASRQPIFPPTQAENGRADGKGVVSLTWMAFAKAWAAEVSVAGAWAAEAVSSAEATSSTEAPFLYAASMAPQAFSIPRAARISLSDSSRRRLLKCVTGSLIFMPSSRSRCSSALISTSGTPKSTLPQSVSY